MWTTVAGLGDRDTTCAIVGGIVVLASGTESIPEPWRDACEPIDEEPVMTRNGDRRWPSTRISHA